MKNPIKLIATLLVAALASSTLFGNGQEGLASDGETLSGRIINLSIKPGATVTFNGVDVTCSVKDMVGGAVNCLGDATIILADGSKNTVVSEMACTSAIYVPTNHTLTIRGGGSLEAKATKDYCAAIGACSKWLGVNEDRGQCGNIVIAGGKVTAVAGGSYAAAIGAASYKGRCGDITICGNADVTAVAGYSAAAIGAAGNGGSCGDITIKDSASVKATAMAYPAKYNHERYGNNGAGIGGGNDSPCGNIVIATTGRIEAIGAAGRFGGAGIGAGGFSSDSHGCGDCGEIVISNGVIVATGRGEASGIGGSTGAGCGNIRILGGDITATGGTGSAGIGICSTNSAIIIAGGKVLATAGPFDGNLPYWAHTAVGIGASWEGHNIGSITISGGKVEAVGARCCPAIGKSYGGSCQSVTITDGIEEVIARKGSDSKEHIGSNSESKPCAVSIAKSLSQTYSEDKTTLILGHGGGTSGRGETGGGTTQGGGGASSSGGGGTSSSGGGTTSQDGGSSSQGSGASGNWLCRMSFDDSANPLKAEGVADAFVRKGRKGTTERVSGMGDIKWTSAGGDGAVEIPKDWHIALPVPDKLAKEPGHPYSIEMRFRLSTLDDWQPLLNMPADNETDSLVYVNKVDSRLAIKQHNKASGTAVYGGSGFVVGKDHTLVVNFGADKTTAFLDGKQVFTRECTLAGSYADCSKAGGYFLIRGDEDGEGGTVTFYEVKVYDGAVGATTPAENVGGAENKNSPSNTTSPSPVATPTVNNPASPAGGKNGQTAEPSAEVQQTLTTFSEDNGLSAAEKIPALKAYIETHLDEPGIEKLIDLLETLAKEANDEETLKWVEEIRKKLAEKNSKPDNQGDSGGTNQVRGGPGVMISRLNFESKDNPLKNLFPSPPVLLRDNKTNVIQNPISYISVGVSIDDGAISLQKNHHLALPIPEILTKEPGHPYSISMKIWPSKTSGCKPLLNMPADNKTDALVSITPNGQIALKQHGKSSGSAIYGDRGFRFVIQTVLLQFDTNRTRIFLDGKEILSHESPLAGSSADCSKAGGYFLLHGDKDGEDNSVTFFDVAVYDGIVDPKKVFGFNLSEDVPLDVKPGGIKPGSGIVWRHRKNGGKRLDWDLPPDQYRILGEISIPIKWFRPSQALPDGGEKEFLACSQNRFDGYFRIEDRLAGKWKMTCGGYDDYMALAIDGKWIFKHPTSSEKTTLNWQATEGIHRFTVVFGDTWGEWGNCIESGMATPIMLDMNDGENTLSFELFANEYRVAKDNVDYLCRKSKKRPSAEFKETVGKFVSDGGIDGAKKVPALKEYIETHLDEPGIELLIELLEQIAKEANDAETLKWVEEIRKKLADRKSGGGTVEGPGKQGNTGGNQPTGTNPTSPVGEEPPNVNPADNGNPSATPAQTDPGNTPTTNPPATTNSTGGGGGGGKTTGTTGGGGDEPQPGSGENKPPTEPEDTRQPFDDVSTEETKTVEDVKIPDGLDMRTGDTGVWRLASIESKRNPSTTNVQYEVHGTRHTMRCGGKVYECSVEEPAKLVRDGGFLIMKSSGMRTEDEKPEKELAGCFYAYGRDKNGKAIPHATGKYGDLLPGCKTPEYTLPFMRLKFAGGEDGSVAKMIVVFKSKAGYFAWTYEYGRANVRSKGGCWRMANIEVRCSPSIPKGDRVAEPYDFANKLAPKTVFVNLFKASPLVHRRRWEHYAWYQHFDEGERLAAYCDFDCYCSQPPFVGFPDDEIEISLKYNTIRNPNVGNIQRIGTNPTATIGTGTNPWKIKFHDKYGSRIGATSYTSDDAGVTVFPEVPGHKLKSSNTPEMVEKLNEGWKEFDGALVFSCENEQGYLTSDHPVIDDDGKEKLVPTKRQGEIANVYYSYSFPDLWNMAGMQQPTLRIVFYTACRCEGDEGRRESATRWIYEWEDEEIEEVDPSVHQDEPKTEEPEDVQQGEAAIKFAQNGMGLPANKDKFVLKSEDKKKNKVGLDEYRIPFAVLNMPTNREYTVTASFRRMGAAGEDGRYLEADAVKEPIPYSVEVAKDKEHGDKGLWEAVIKETGTYELPAGTSEGILLKVVAESGKKGDKDYVKVYETFPIYRIHLGLSFMLQANTIPCYLEMGEKSKYKLDKQDIAGDPEKDPDDKYVIRQEDFEVPMREGAMMLLLYDEDREDFIRIPAVPSETRVTATKVANDRYCQARDAEENHQELVDRLCIKTISTGKTRANGSHVVKIAPTRGVLDSPLRLLADLEVDAVYSNRVSNFSRTFTAKKQVLLHSQPLRVIENADDERQYLERDTHIRKQLERIMFKIEGTCIGRLFALRNMIERMIDGYDYRFGYDERQVKTVMETYVGFIQGTFEGANGVPYKVTFGDDLKACYAFMQGLRDNTGFLGRMAMGVLTGGVSEHVFTTMTVLENMQSEIMTCKDAKEFGFLAAFKIGAEEIGKQVLMEMIAQGAIQGAAKAANIDVNATMQMWAGRYRNAMDGADSWLKSKSGLYKAGDKALQSCKNFLGGGTKAAAKAVENVVRSEEEAAKRAEELLKKSRNEMSPAELKAVKQYEEAMENGLKKVRNLQKAQQAMEDAAKNNRPALKAAKEEYRRLADEVWSDKCALKKLQEVRGDYAKRMRAQFNNYRENLLDSVQREALGDIAKELGVPPDQLYLMNASNGVKTDYLTGKKVPGDRDISYMQKVLSDRTKDLTIDQSIGQRSVARRLWKKMHGGQEPPSIDEALKFMKGKDVTYVNPNGDAASYVFEHNLDGYEDLPGMVGMTKDGKINKNLLANDLHNPTINAASIKHKGVEWWGPTASDKLARAAEWEALAAKYQGSAKAKLLEKAFDLRCQAVGDVCEGIRQITKQTDNIIVPRGANRVLGHPMPAHLQDLHALAKRVGQDVSPAEFTKALQKYKLDLNTWADQVSKCLNAKNVPVLEINVPNFFTPKAINDALDREQKKRR